MKRLIYILILVVFFGFDSEAQDPQVSQFYAAPTLLAPSMAGTTFGSRVAVNYRDQWPAIPGKFITYTLAYDHFFPGMNSGVGIIFLKDRAGTGHLSTTNFGFQYSYKIVASQKIEIRPGIQLYHSSRSTDFYRHTFSDQISFNGIAPVTHETPAFDKVGYMDFAASLFVYSEQYWGGFVLDHLVKPNQSLMGSVSEVPILLKVFGGAKVGLNDSRGKWNEETLTPTFLYKAQGKYDQLDVGAYWNKMAFVVGFWYRGLPGIKAYKKGYGNSDAITLLVGYRLEDMKVGYSYDFTISKLVNSTNGSHELSLIYEFNQNQKLKRRRSRVVVPCPKF